MIECIVTSSVLIAVVIALRFIFAGKISRRLRYALWGLVLLRLALPFSLLESHFSVMNILSDTGLAERQVYALPASDPAGGYTVGVTDGEGSRALLPENKTSPAPEAGKSKAEGTLRLIWLLGAAFLSLWLIGSNLLFYRRLKGTRKALAGVDCRLPVYVAGALASPCLFGLFRPCVYLTPKAVENEAGLRHVLTHELCHWRHGDHIWSILRGVCLAVYWFDPLVWAAAILSRADGELACDEAVVRTIGEDNRLSYGRTLIDMIAVKKIPSGLLSAATTMVSDKRGVQERLKMIIRTPKTYIPALVAVLLIISACVGSTFTGAKAAPLSAQEALESLAQSLSVSDGEASFQIPQGYENPADWNIHIAGRLASDGFSQSIHLMEDVNDAKGWEPGKRYTIPLQKGYTELTLTAFLPGENGQTLEKSLDLLGSSSSVSYALIRLEEGKVVYALSPLAGEEQGLAEDVIMNYMVKSAAWPGVDIKRLKECYKISAAYADKSRQDYYAYEMDGMAVMQMGEEGHYSRIDDGLYEKLVKLAKSGVTETGGADGPAGVTVSADPADLDACVGEAILSANAGRYQQYDYAAEAHTVLATEEKDDEVTVWVMALYLQFGYAGGGFFETGGSHMPAAATFTKSAAGEYELQEYWMPRDGSDYAPSIKEKFPPEIYNEALDTQKFILAHTQVCYQKAVEHGNVVADREIEKRLEIIESSPAHMSNPGAYIEAHPIEYRALLYYGDYTLRYAYREFLKGGQTDLRAHILLAAMRDLLCGEDRAIASYMVADEGESLSGIGTAQEWFDKWKALVLQARDLNKEGYMEQNYPKTCILLKMLDETEPAGSIKETEKVKKKS